MLKSHAQEILEKARQGREQALEVMGDTATALVRAQMRSGYASPVEETGALIADVQWTRRDEETILVGSTLPYAGAVHNGTARMAARPYLTDALEHGAAQLMDAAARSLDDALR